jgi:hypothetical protein
LDDTSNNIGRCYGVPLGIITIEISYAHSGVRYGIKSINEFRPIGSAGSDDIVDK